MKTQTNIKEKEISHFYSDDDRLKAVVMEGDECFFVDFYKDDVIIDSRRVEGHTLRYAEDMAENYISGVIWYNHRTGRVHGV